MYIITHRHPSSETSHSHVKNPKYHRYPSFAAKLPQSALAKRPAVTIYTCHYVLQIANAVLAWTVLHWLQPHCLWFPAYCKDSKKSLTPELSITLPHTELFFSLEHVFFWSQSETAMPHSKSCSQSQAATATLMDTFPGTACKISLSTTPGDSLETIPGDILQTFTVVVCKQLLVIMTVWKQFLVIFCKHFIVVVCKQFLVTVWKQFLVILCKHFPANKNLKKKKKIWATVVNNLWWQLQTNLDFDNHINC